MPSLRCAVFLELKKQANCFYWGCHPYHHCCVIDRVLEVEEVAVIEVITHVIICRVTDTVLEIKEVVVTEVITHITAVLLTRVLEVKDIAVTEVITHVIIAVLPTEV